MYRPSNQHHDRTPGGLYIPMDATLKGRVRWQVLDERMVPEVPRTPSGLAIGPAEGVEQDNLITDAGLDRIGSMSPLDFQANVATYRGTLRVGTGSAAPNVADTALDNEVQSATSIGSFTAGSATYARVTGDNVFRATIVATRVVTMNADRNLTEFGLAPGTNDLTLRELLRDGGGSPITVSLLNGKTLRLDHTLTIELPHPATGQQTSINIEIYDAGNNLINTIPYDITYGPVASQSSAYSNVFLAWDPTNTRTVRRITTGVTFDRSDGLISNSNATPGQANPGLVNVAPVTYTTGTYTRTKRGTVAVGDANAAWYGFVITSNSFDGNGASMTGIVTLFDDPATYTKVNTDTLRVGLISTWARA